MLADMDTISHAEVKKTEKSTTTETIDEADRDGEIEANEEELLRIIALRAPGPTAMFKVSSTPKKCCTPPNLVDGHSAVSYTHLTLPTIVRV